MKKLVTLICATTMFTLTSSAVLADSIKGKIGATAQLGFLIPADGDIGPYKNSSDVGFVIGGGLIYGIDDHFAAEINVSRSMYGTEFGDFGVTNLSLGGQYRFLLSRPQLVPYLGAGLDLLMGDAERGLDVDTTVGAHVAGGVDYFIMKQLALTAEAKLILAPDTDINDSHGKRGNFDPSGFSTTFGLRFFFN